MAHLLLLPEINSQNKQESLLELSSHQQFVPQRPLNLPFEYHRRLIKRFTNVTENTFPTVATSGVWNGGVFYEDSEEDLQVDERIRTISLLKREQPCVTSSGIKGTCKKRIYCNKQTRIFWGNRDPDFCLIHGLFVGVCCPDEFPTAPSYNDTSITIPLDPQTSAKPSENPDSQSASDSKQGCGLAPGFDGRIVGGWRVSGEGRWPWIAALLRDDGQTHFCGGTLITNRHILTAAHCLHNLEASDIRIRLGEFHLDEPSEAEVNIEVGEIIRYMDYNRLTYENDIAILALKSKVEFEYGLIWPACLPPVSPSDEDIEENDPLTNRSAIVTGWGTIYFGGPASPVLLEVEVPIWKQKNCRESFVQVIEPTVLCAGELKGGKDSCQGDSGGPLVVMNELGRWDVVGVVSWGIRCGEPRKPGVYTRVGKYIDWILDNTT